ncbi:hypothetical protein GVAV_001067 [Gurleya vavrai]
MLLITNLSFIFSAVNIMSFYDKITEDKDTVLKMQKEICDAGRNIACLTFKFNSQLETSDNFFNFIHASLLDLNFFILNKQVEIIYSKDQEDIVNENHLFENFFLSLLNHKFNNLNQSIQNFKDILIEKDTITRENFISYKEIDSKITLFNEQDFTKNEYLHIYKELKLNYNTILQKKERLFVFICKDYGDKLFNYPVIGKLKLNDVYKKYQSVFDEVCVIYTKNYCFNKLRDWDLFFIRDKYLIDKNEDEKLFKFFYGKRYFENNIDFTYNTFYYDLIADFQYSDKLDGETYNKINQFLNKNILNDVHQIKIDLTFGKTFNFILILFRTKIEESINLYNETIRVLFKENTEYSFF